MKSVVRGLQAAACALAVLVGGVVLAGPAHAADGHVYLVVQNRNCPNGGTINEVRGTVHTTYGFRQMWNGGDRGDNILYPKAEFGTSNTFTGRALCMKGSRSAWINVVRDFTPRSGQTVWL
jgi:hypothetical protein